MTVVRFAVLPAASIFNLTSPRWLPEISMSWSGKRPWHDQRYEPLRDIIETMYVDGFNSVSGHYERLEASIIGEGIRNPIIVSAGRLERRSRSEIPPQLRDRPDLIVSEYLGGSRLWVAQKLGMPVPCIINDHAGTMTHAQALTSREAILDRFLDKPRLVSLGEAGAVIGDVPYVHLAKPYTVAEQSVVRRGIISGIRGAVAQWLRTNDAA